MNLELLASLIGIVYIILEYRASWWLWIVGIIMSLFYIYIFANVNCYAWSLTYLYYLGANIYGIIVWKKNNTKDSYLGITHLPRKYYSKLLGIIVLLSLFLFFIIHRFTDSVIPVSESFSTALSIVGMWLMAKKYVQHWYVWLVVNTIYVMGNLYQELYFSAILFMVYFLVSILGLLHWRKLAGK